VIRGHREDRAKFLPLLFTCLSLSPLFLFLSCEELTVRQNYSGFRSEEEIAVFSQRGYKYRLQGDLNPHVDRLQLVPGNYMIEFLDQFSMIRGAAYCEVKAGVHYIIEPRGFRDFPDQMKRMIVGGCVPQPVKEK
jgi:hypothetical protein